ncbi:TPA: hypothetical protein ACH3X3_004725 [Trebouxia sp. C0006]
MELRVKKLIQQSAAKRTVPDEVFAEHGRPQTTPIAGGCTADPPGKWNLPGDAGITDVELRAIDTHDQRTHIPHEVKGPWAEQHAGSPFTDVLQDQTPPRLDPSQRPTTAAELKWGCVDTKRKRSDRIVNDPVGDGDSDDGAEDNNRNAASGKGKEKADDADANDSVDTAGADRPSAHTRSKDVKPPVQHASVKTRNVSRTHALCTLRADCEQWLTQLPLFARPSLDFNTIRIGKNYVVRRGRWCHQLAVFKVWNLGFLPAPVEPPGRDTCL